MRKLEELGISQAPWRKIIDEFGDEESQYLVAVADSRFPVGTVTLSGDYCEADAMLISAAPELYEALLEALPWFADIGAEVVGNEAAEKIAAVVAKAEAALRKASGESEVTK